MMKTFSIDEIEAILFEKISQTQFHNFVTVFQVDPCLSIGIDHELQDSPEELIRTKKTGKLSYHDKGQVIVCVGFKGINHLRILLSVESIIKRVLLENGIQAVSFRDFRGVYSERKQLCPITFWVQEDGSALVAAALNVSGDLDKHNSCKDLCGKSHIEAISVESLGGISDLVYWADAVNKNILAELNNTYSNQFIGLEL